MNKLIKDFAAKSNVWYPEGYPSSEGGDAAWRNLVIFEKEDLQKFADLIVRECVDIVKQKWIDPDEDVIAESIKEHFGVE